MRKNKNPNVLKSEAITIRCTLREKEKLHKMAKNKNKTLSEYLLDCGIASLERRSDKDRKRVVQMIANAEIFNEIFRYLKENPDVFSEEQKMKMKELMEGSCALWRI